MQLIAGHHPGPVLVPPDILFPHITVHDIFVDHPQQPDIGFLIGPVDHLFLIRLQIVQGNALAIAGTKGRRPGVAVGAFHHHKGAVLHILYQLLQTFGRDVVSIDGVGHGKIIYPPAAHITVILEILFQLLISRAAGHIDQLPQFPLRRIFI